MNDPQLSSNSISGQEDRLPSRVQSSPLQSEQLALPLTHGELAESSKYLNSLPLANRFRLMFGQPLLSEKRENGMFR